MYNLVITLRKEYEDPEEARQAYDMVKERLNDHPEIIVTGHITNHFAQEEPPS